MNSQARKYVSAFLVGAVFTILVAGVSALPRCSAVGVLLAPGMLLAAILFPEGPHSDRAMTWFVTAGLIDAFVFAFLAMLLWPRVVRFYRDRKMSGNSVYCHDQVGPGGRVQLLRQDNGNAHTRRS